ncbi:MAG: NAD(P)-dependent dehydrogenase (short-subunit alcohol dehydrogenase family) [Gammaproteobacteria bacterium]|jgi:NAD(P)-dependent dehydrogenase (short-subunit alcohol dehydrogenase family)
MVKGLRVLVTAGASGIGLAIAEAMAREGAQLHVCDISEQALAACSAAHSDWSTSLCDVSQESQVAKLFEDVANKLGGLDVLVNNAGIAGPTGGIDSLSSDDWNQTIDVNLNGQFYCTRLAVPMLKQSDNASIICISSVAGRLGYAYRTPYAATKWAIIGLVKSLAIELGPHGIRVNALLPGIVEGPRIEQVIADRAAAVGVTHEEMTEEYINKVSLRKMVTAEDVANQALFLCSSLGASISGQPISVCGNVEYL